MTVGGEDKGVGVKDDAEGAGPGDGKWRKKRG